MTLPPGCAHTHARAAESFRLSIVAGMHVSPDAQAYLHLRPVAVPNSLRTGLRFLGNFIGPLGEMVNQQELSSNKTDVGSIFLLGVKKPQPINIQSTH